MRKPQTNQAAPAAGDGTLVLAKAPEEDAIYRLLRAEVVTRARLRRRGRRFWREFAR